MTEEEEEVQLSFAPLSKQVTEYLTHPSEGKGSLGRKEKEEKRRPIAALYGQNRR